MTVLDGFLIVAVVACVALLAWQNWRQRSAASALSINALEALTQASEKACFAAEAASADAERSRTMIQDQLRVSVDYIRISHRPWLFVNPVDIEIRGRTPGQNPSLIHFCVENGGQTPAVDVRLYFQCLQSVVLKFDPESVPADREEKVMIGPRSKLRASARFEAENEVAVSTWYFIGRAKYKDVFGQEYMTVWCYRYNPIRSLFEPHTQYNSVQ